MRKDVKTVKKKGGNDRTDDKVIKVSRDKRIKKRLCCSIDTARL